MTDNKPLRDLIAEAKAEVTEEIEEHKEEEEEEETEAHLVSKRVLKVASLTLMRKKILEVGSFCHFSFVFGFCWFGFFLYF